MSKPLDRMTLLETFVRISERGSISAAARDLQISQASASRQLKELEERFGTQLIRRTTHSLRLTAAGHDLLGDARALIANWETLFEQHAGTDGEIKGPLKVVAPIALGQLYLANIALEFQIAHPKVNLEWHLEDNPIRFAEEGCDCWIRVGPIPDDTLIIRELGQIERLVVASPGYENAASMTMPEEVSSLPFVALAPYEGGHIRLYSDQGQTVELKPKTPVVTNNIFSVRKAALMGVGAAILPRWFVEDDLNQGRLLHVIPTWHAPELRIRAAFLPARHQPKRLEAFLDAITQGVREIPGIKV